MTRAWLAVPAAFAIACGRGATGAQGGADRAGGEGAGGPAPGSTCDGPLSLLARGVDGGDLTTFDLDVSSIEARGSDGLAVGPLGSASGAISLAGGATPLLATFPRTAGAVDVTVHLCGVHVCGGGSCRDLDVCTAPIGFRYDVDQAIASGCKVFVQLDLAGSVQPLAAGAAFLPRFSLKYW